MAFDTGTWWLISILLTALITIIGALISRTVFGKLDENTKDIKQVRENYTPRADHTKDIGSMRDELKTDVKSVREELRCETRKLASDIEDIKENCLRKEDFIRAMADSNNRATTIDHKIDKLMEMVYSIGGSNG